MKKNNLFILRKGAVTQDAGLTVLSRMSQYWFVQWQWLLWPPGSVGAST